MAATNSTPNLELSQFIGSDKPDWLTDYNGDMVKIDSSYGAVSAIAEEAAANAESAAASAAQATTDAAAAVSAVAGAVEAAQAATAAAEQATTTATSALQIANGAASTAQGAAGDATTALSVAQNAKETAESAQAAAAAAAESAEEAAETAQAASSPVIGDAIGAYALSDGTKTVKQVLMALAAEIDITKVRRNSYIVKTSRSEAESGHLTANNTPRYVIDTAETIAGTKTFYAVAPWFRDDNSTYRYSYVCMYLSELNETRDGIGMNTSSQIQHFSLNDNSTTMSNNTGYCIVY